MERALATGDHDRRAALLDGDLDCRLEEGVHLALRFLHHARAFAALGEDEVKFPFDFGGLEGDDAARIVDEFGAAGGVIHELMPLLIGDGLAGHRLRGVVDDHVAPAVIAVRLAQAVAQESTNLSSVLDLAAGEGVERVEPDEIRLLLSADGAHLSNESVAAVHLFADHFDVAANDFEFLARQLHDRLNREPEFAHVAVRVFGLKDHGLRWALGGDPEEVAPEGEVCRPDHRERGLAHAGRGDDEAGVAASEVAVAADEFIRAVFLGEFHVSKALDLGRLGAVPDRRHIRVDGIQTLDARGIVSLLLRTPTGSDDLALRAQFVDLFDVVGGLRRGPHASAHLHEKRVAADAFELLAALQLLSDHRDLNRLAVRVEGGDAAKDDRVPRIVEALRSNPRVEALGHNVRAIEHTG